VTSDQKRARAFGGALQGLTTIPEGPWELGPAVYCIVWGFRPSPIHEGDEPEELRAATVPAPAAA
jgi:hypothetical protein